MNYIYTFWPPLKDYDLGSWFNDLDLLFLRLEMYVVQCLETLEASNNYWLLKYWPWLLKYWLWYWSTDLDYWPWFTLLWWPWPWPFISEIGNLQNLETLEASNNYLSNIPVSLAYCSQLKLLALDKNRLKLFPRQLVRLKKLTELSLAGNQLEYLPPSKWPTLV